MYISLTYLPVSYHCNLSLCLVFMTSASWHTSCVPTNDLTCSLHSWYCTSPSLLTSRFHILCVHLYGVSIIMLAMLYMRTYICTYLRTYSCMMKPYSCSRKLSHRHMTLPFNSIRCHTPTRTHISSHDLLCKIVHNTCTEVKCLHPFVLVRRAS